jgi:hypothetical protein
MSWPVACLPNHFHNLKKHLFSIIANFCGGMYLGTGIVWKIFYNANKFAAGICRKKLQIHVQIKEQAYYYDIVSLSIAQVDTSIKHYINRSNLYCTVIENLCMNWISFKRSDLKV